MPPEVTQSDGEEELEFDTHISIHGTPFDSPGLRGRSEVTREAMTSHERTLGCRGHQRSPSVGHPLLLEFVIEVERSLLGGDQGGSSGVIQRLGLTDLSRLASSLMAVRNIKADRDEELAAGQRLDQAGESWNLESDSTPLQEEDCEFGVGRQQGTEQEDGRTLGVLETIMLRAKALCASGELAGTQRRKCRAEQFGVGALAVGLAKLVHGVNCSYRGDITLFAHADVASLSAPAGIDGQSPLDTSQPERDRELWRLRERNREQDRVRLDRNIKVLLLDFGRLLLQSRDGLGRQGYGAGCVRLFLSESAQVLLIHVASSNRYACVHVPAVCACERL